MTTKIRNCLKVHGIMRVAVSWGHPEIKQLISLFNISIINVFDIFTSLFSWIVSIFFGPNKDQFLLNHRIKHLSISLLLHSASNTSLHEVLGINDKIHPLPKITFVQCLKNKGAAFLLVYFYAGYACFNRINKMNHI